MKLYLILILLLPLLGGTVNAVAGRFLPRRAVATLACTVVWGAFAASLAAYTAYTAPQSVRLASWLATFDLTAPIALFIDPLSLVMVMMITFVCGLIHLYSVAYMAEERDQVRYFALLNLFVFAMLTLVLAENLPLLYFGWEGVGFCSYALIGFWYREEKNADAGRKAFIVTRVGDTLFGIAIIWLFQLCGTFSIPELNRLGFLLPAGVVSAIALLLLGGAMGKSAQVPLMVWLPDAMAGPTPVSALIHAATMVTAGVYLLARMLPLIEFSPAAMAAIAATGGITAFYAATCALAQRDMKRLLAYSTISQIGYMVMGVGAGAVAASLFHLVVHAFFKALLFLGAGCVIMALHHEQDIYRMGGLRRSLPVTFWAFLAGAVSLAGIPGTGGFFSKDAVLAAVAGQGTGIYPGLYLLGLLTALLTSVYTFRMIYLVFAGEGPAVRKSPRLMEWVLFPLAFLSLAGGMLDLPAYLGEGWLKSMIGSGGTHPAPSREMLLQVIAGFLALAGLATAHYRYGGARRAARIAASHESPEGVRAFLLNGWYADRVYHFLFVAPYRHLARLFWLKIDEGAIDDSLDRLARLTGLWGRQLGLWTHGRISGYLFSFVAGAAGLILYLTWSVVR